MDIKLYGNSRRTDVTIKEREEQRDGDEGKAV